MVPDIEQDREVKGLWTAQHKEFLVEIWITSKVNTEKIKLKKKLLGMIWGGQIKKQSSLYSVLIIK